MEAKSVATLTCAIGPPLTQIICVRREAGHPNWLDGISISNPLLNPVEDQCGRSVAGHRPLLLPQSVKESLYAMSVLFGVVDIGNVRRADLPLFDDTLKALGTRVVTELHRWCITSCSERVKKCAAMAFNLIPQ